MSLQQEPDNKKRSPANVRGRKYPTLAAAIVALALAACGNGGEEGPLVADGCAYVDLNRPLTGQRLPGSASGRFTYAIVADGARGHAEITNPLTGEFVYQPFENSRGTDSFTFRAHDGDSSSVATYRIVYVPRIMPLGDSITWGGPGEDCPQHVGYRKPLHDALLALGYQVDFVGTLRSGHVAGLADPDHEGHGAWTAEQLVAGGRSDECTGSGSLATWLNADEGQPDVVLLHIGTNDLNPAGDQSGQSVWVAEILEVVDSWERDNWPVTVIVSKIINTKPGDPLSTPQRLEETRAFNGNVASIVNARISGGDRLVLVDHESALDRANYYADHLHPNAAGYERMAEVWRQALVGVLPKCP